MFKGKNVLITGSEGLIGKELHILLQKEGANVKLADLKKGNDLRNFKECLNLTNDIDIVFHLAGITGNPRMTNERPVSFLGPMLQFDTNMIIASQINEVEKFLYTSSIGVENQDTDKYPAWAKSTGEKLIEAMRIQYPTTKWCIVRPANVYGRFVDFSKTELMVIGDLIRKGLNPHSKEIEIWGDGKQVRDFINAKDVACGMVKCMQEMPKEPINLCSGQGIQIKEIAEIISNKLNKKLKFTGINKGSQNRVMKINWDFKPEIDIKKGILEVIEWKQKNP